jgi:tRNA(Leu) C34 or U34 (ribose-2'-O)-methylase TrmL
MNSLPIAIVDIILDYAHIKKHHGQYSQQINVKEFENIEKFLQKRKKYKEEELFHLLLYGTWRRDE